MLALLLVACMTAGAQSPEVFRPYKATRLRLPAVPLVVNDPYLSIWSPYDRLTDGSTRHWTDAEKPLEGLLRVDGKVYRFMGDERRAILEAVAPMAADTGWDAAYTNKKQADGWQQPDFDDKAWQHGKGAFGSSGDGIRTRWEAEQSDIYIRREVNLSQQDLANELYAIFSHDDACELYINGTKVATGRMTAVYDERVHLTGELKRLLHPGRNVMGFHVYNNRGGAYADFGLFRDVSTTNAGILKAEQQSVNVLATSTYYTFNCGPVELSVVFTAPMLIDDLDLLSTPVNYISYQVRPLDKRSHDVQFYLSASPLIGTDKANQPTVSTVEQHQGVSYLKTGTVDQPILAKKGDGICIDWGYLYLPGINGTVSLGGDNEVKGSFLSSGKLPATQQRVVARRAGEMPTLAYVHDFGAVQGPAASYMLIGYDEIQDIEYMYRRYKAYWAHEGKVSIFDAFARLNASYASVMQRCRALDRRIYDDGMASGNAHYAEILSASYRQVMAAHKLFTDNEGHLLYFSKENNSNGCVNTVDLTYPSAPLYLVYNPQLEKAMMTSIFEYSRSGRWTKPFAAHDLGTYPIANGQVYGGDMPIEEAGNMVTLTAMLSKLDGNTQYADQYWDLLTLWTDYLVANGQDPANQLCTDDFAGHWAHNCNLSAKAIMGVAGYAEMARMRGDEATASKYMDKAREMAQEWERQAREADHYRLAFDRADTWSQKYNMVWDKLWGTNLFPNDAIGREVSYYLKKQNKYGLPLDIRRDYTKTDWIMWTAAMSKDKKTFLRFVEPVYTYINETPSRVPISDWSDTKTAEMVGFKARSVIGGYWMQVLAHKLARR